MRHLDNPQYIPGVCNIGPAEIAVRRKVGWIGAASTVFLGAMFVYSDIGGIWLLLLFFSSVISAVGFIQGIMHFCAAFGLRSVFNFGSEVGRTDTVTQAEFRAQDRKKAWQILAYSVLVGLSVTLTTYLVK